MEYKKTLHSIINKYNRSLPDENKINITEDEFGITIDFGFYIIKHKHLQSGEERTYDSLLAIFLKDMFREFKKNKENYGK